MPLSISIRADPGSETRNAGIDTRILSASAAETPRADTDDYTVVVERTTGVTLALVATADVQPTGAQHIGCDVCSTVCIPRSTNSLVDSPNLDVLQLLRGKTTRLQTKNTYKPQNNIIIILLSINQVKLSQSTAGHRPPPSCVLTPGSPPFTSCLIQHPSSVRRSIWLGNVPHFAGSRSPLKDSSAPAAISPLIDMICCHTATATSN